MVVVAGGVALAVAAGAAVEIKRSRTTAHEGAIYGNYGNYGAIYGCTRRGAQGDALLA